jgi:hypothetical protein
VFATAAAAVQTAKSVNDFPFREFLKFNNVKSTLSRLALRKERLRLADAPADSLLNETSILTGVSEQL